MAKASGFNSGSSHGGIVLGYRLLASGENLKRTTNRTSAACVLQRPQKRVGRLRLIRMMY